MKSGAQLMRDSIQPRSGLSVIETVVAVLLLFLLAILLLPAVERARGSAIGNHTKNNLRRIGVGMSSYHVAHNTFPH